MPPVLDLQSIRIIPYKSELQPAFERLNLEWLEGYHLLEEEDLKFLRDPERVILASGGQVFFALLGEDVVGTVAAIRQGKTTMELAKLSVLQSARRHGIGRKLSESVIAFARQSGAMQVVLTSNSALTGAIALYESMGFRHAPMPPDNRYRTANVSMILDL